MGNFSREKVFLTRLLSDPVFYSKYESVDLVETEKNGKIEKMKKYKRRNFFNPYLAN